MVTNPDWILCKHQKWSLDFTSKINGLQLIAANEEKGELYLLNDTYFLTYSFKDKSFKKTFYKNDTINFTIDHKAIYNENDGNIYCYLIDKQTFSMLDIESGKWSNLSPFQNPDHKQYFQNHTSVFSKKENSIYTFSELDFSNPAWRGGGFDYLYYSKQRYIFFLPILVFLCMDVEILPALSKGAFQKRFGDAFCTPNSSSAARREGKRECTDLSILRKAWRCCIDHDKCH